ncbi:hypothetical protein CBL_13532 [Carabus blaptoides fortunei]
MVYEAKPAEKAARDRAHDSVALYHRTESIFATRFRIFPVKDGHMYVYMYLCRRPCCSVTVVEPPHSAQGHANTPPSRGVPLRLVHGLTSRHWTAVTDTTDSATSNTTRTYRHRRSRFAILPSVFSSLVLLVRTGLPLSQRKPSFYDSIIIQNGSGTQKTITVADRGNVKFHYAIKPPDLQQAVCGARHRTTV